MIRIGQTKPRLPGAVALALLACAASLQAEPGMAAPPDVFGPAASAPTGVAIEPEVVRSRPVVVHDERLAATAPGEKLSLNLWPDASFVGVVERIERRSENRYSVFGRLDEDPFGSFIIVVEEDAAAAVIRAPLSSQLFSLRYFGDGVPVIQEIDSALILPCDGGVAQQWATPPPPAPDVQEGGILPEPGAPRACSPTSTVFDVLIVYTHLARAADGGTTAINARCQLAIDQTNQDYTNSQISARMRLVYRGEVTYDDTAGTMSDHLNRITSTSDGIMDGVHTLRDTYAADCVSLWVTGPGAGLGWCIASASSAFSVVRYTNATNSYSFEHEIGHNQGCAHDRDNVDCSGSYSYSYGYRWWGDSASQWRSIMAYAPGTRIQYFSNPNVLFDGQPTGMTIGDPNEAANAQTINNRRSTVEGFRTTRFDIWVDFSYAGSESGTFSAPYDTLAEGLANITAGVGASELPNLRIKAGSTSETATITTPMMIRPCGGTVTIGA